MLRVGRTASISKKDELATLVKAILCSFEKQIERGFKLSSCNKGNLQVLPKNCIKASWCGMRLRRKLTEFLHCLHPLLEVKRTNSNPQGLKRREPRPV